MKHQFLTPAICVLAAISLAACGGGKKAAQTPATHNDTAAPALSEAISIPAGADRLLMPLPTNTSAQITAEDLGTRTAALADDTFEGRGAGTEIGEAAAFWIAEEMKRIGLQPGGDNGTYFQHVGMVNQTLDENRSGLSVSLENQTENGPLSLALGQDAVIWTKRQNATDLEFENSEMIFVGYGIVAPEYGWNDYDGLDATGKTVVMLVNDPGYASGDSDLFKGKAMTYYGRWTYKYEEAARQGATAAIIVHETEPASYGWDVVANSWSGAQSDLVRADGGAGRTMLEGWISHDMATRLFEMGGLDLEDMKNAALTKGFGAVDMGRLLAKGELHQSIERLASRNVIGVLPGTKSPDEYVLYTAHWDHLGKKESGNPDEDVIYNGAVDNGTGVSALLDIAEAMVANKPQRSVLFNSVTLEESGLLGSAYFAENPTVPLVNIVAGINMDGALPTGKSRDMIVVGYGASELEDQLKAVLETQGRVIAPDPKPEAGYFYRSDHISLAKKGVPMLYASGGMDLVNGGVAAGREAAHAYTTEYYHKPGDEYSEDWDLSGAEQDINALYAVGLGIANSSDWPQWYDGNEFKAIRQASRGQR